MLVKICWFLKSRIDRYLYKKCYIPKHADKDFWGDDLV